MQLIRVYANRDTFKTIEFNKAGISFIVAKQKNPGASERGDTYNGVGKSLLVRIIHFCLGADPKDYRIFCDKLDGWIFYADFEAGGKQYTIRRATEFPKKIFLNNEELNVDKFNKMMASFCFSIPDDVTSLSFRSLIPFFIRPKRDSYVEYNKPGTSMTEYQVLLKNAFLLGLDITLARKKYDVRNEQARIKDLIYPSFLRSPILPHGFICWKSGSA